MYFEVYMEHEAEKEKRKILAYLSTRNVNKGNSRGG
jgi:hypothetical protein